MKYHGRVVMSFFAMGLSLLLVLVSVLTLPLDPVLVILSLLLYVVGFIALPKNGKDSFYAAQAEAKKKRQSKTVDKVSSEVAKARTKKKVKVLKPNKVQESEDLPKKTGDTKGTTQTKQPSVRQTHATFPKIFNNALLKYSYYDVEIDNADFTEDEIKNIRTETPLRFGLDDDRSITILDESNNVYGTLPDGGLKDMLFDYADKEDAFVGGHISQVDESAKKIQIALAFYKQLTEQEAQTLPHIDASLIKTKKKDWLGSSRMDNLLGIERGDVVSLDYDFEEGTYTVLNDSAEEIGEINLKTSEKLMAYENEGSELFAYILSVDDEDLDNIKCKVRIILKQ